MSHNKRIIATGILLVNGFFGCLAIQESERAKIIEKTATDLSTLFDGVPCQKIMDGSVSVIKSVCSVPEQLTLLSASNELESLLAKLSVSAKEALRQAILVLQKDRSGEADVAASAKINKLLAEIPFFDRLKHHVANFVVKSSPELHLTKDEVLMRMSAAIAVFMQKTLSDAEVSKLTSFFQNQKIKSIITKLVKNIDTFKKVIEAQVSRDVAAKLQDFCS